MDEHGELVGPGDPVARTERSSRTCAWRLPFRATFADIVKFGIFVADMSILPWSARSAIVTLTVRSRGEHRGLGDALFRPGYPSKSTHSRSCGHDGRCS